MSSTAEFNILPEKWLTIAGSATATGDYFGKAPSITLTLSPYVGPSQGRLEWLCPVPEHAPDVLKGIKRALWQRRETEIPVRGVEWGLPDESPVINVGVSVTEVSYDLAEPWGLEKIASYAVQDALKQIEIVQLDRIADTGFWESEAAQRQQHVDFQVLPIRCSTLSSSVSGLGRYVRQTGGPGLYGIVDLSLEPYKRQTEAVIDWQVTDDQILSGFECSVVTGIRAAAREERARHGPIVNFKATITGGKWHPVDSNNISFQIAAHMAFEDALAKTTLINL